MKVFQLNTFCGIKSTGRIATDIAQLLEKRGHECRVGYGAESAPKALSRFAFHFGNPLERKIHGAIRKLLDGEGYGSHAGTLRLIRELEAFQPDIIHLHNIHGCYLNFRLLFRFLKKSQIPVVWTLHDCWPMTGHCAYFEYAQCSRWKQACGSCPQLRSYPVCLGLDGSRRNLRHKKALFSGLPSLRWITPSNWLKGYVEASWLNAYPAQVIYNGVDLSRFKPVDGSFLRGRHQITAEHVLLAVAAEWDERKGLRYLLEAEKLWGKGYQLVIIGLTPEQISALPPGVLGLTSTQNVDELVAWYSLADCLVNPTLEDNMPMVNLEALACGTPVAVFRTGGCPEVINDACGRVVEQGNAVALAHAAMELAPQKKAFSPACLRKAEQLDSRSGYEQYLQLYEELLS